MKFPKYAKPFLRVARHPAFAIPATLLSFWSAFAVGALTAIGLEYTPIFDIPAFLAGMSVQFSIWTVAAGVLSGLAVMVTAIVQMFREGGKLWAVLGLIVFVVVVGQAMSAPARDLWGWLQTVAVHSSAQWAFALLVLAMACAVYGLTVGPWLLTQHPKREVPKLLLPRTVFAAAAFSLCVIMAALNLGTLWIEYQKETGAQLCIGEDGKSGLAVILGRTGGGFLLYDVSTSSVMHLAADHARVLGGGMAAICGTGHGPGQQGKVGP